MKKLLLFGAVLALGLIKVQAQQEVRYTQYMFNKLVFNPGYAGSRDGLSFTGIGRYQWVNIEGSPKGGALSLHAPVGNEKKVGLGGYVQYDQLGAEQNISAFASYAYRFDLGESKLAAGIQGGVLYHSFDVSKMKGNEFITPDTDPTLQENENKFLPNFGVGLYYYKPNSYYLGVSAPELLTNNLRKEQDGISVIAKQFRHYYLTGGLVFNAGEALKIHPSLLFKYVPNNAPLQFDANLMFLLKDVFWIGASYRHAFITEADKASESVDGIIAFQLKNGLKIGYAYDYTLSDIRRYTSGSHEIMLGFDVKNGNERIVTPRYFSTNEYF